MVAIKFFKPSLSKIILFAIIGIMSLLLVYAYAANHALVCTSSGCPSVEKSALSTTLNSTIPVLMLSYLLACIIASLFNKADHKNMWIPLLNKIKLKKTDEKEKVERRHFPKKETSVKMRKSEIKSKIKK